MRSSLLATLAAGLLAVSAAAHAAVMLSADSISLPIFDPTGKLTHKLLAKSGTMRGSMQTLRGVELQLFSPTEPGVVVQRLEAEDAVWDADRQMLVGKGEIVVTAADNRLSGQGFEFSLLTSRLLIHRDFSLINPELVLNSDRAIIDLILEKQDKDVKFRDVGRCEAVGNLRVVAAMTAAKKFGFEKAFSDRAIYEGATRIVTFPGPTRTVTGQYEISSKEMKLELEPPRKSPPLPAP